MTIPESATQWAINIANDKTHGYSQQSRWGPDYDCSSLALSAFKQAGVPIDFNKVCYTGNMQNLTQYGFKDVVSKVNLNTGNGLQRGDILWWHSSGTSGHTAIYIGNNQIVHARGQSYGSSKTGDQGSEIAVTAYYRGSWQHVYRYTGNGNPIVTPTPATPVKEMCSVTVNLPLIKYGSVGSAVAVWQQIIGVEVDGEFGTRTHLGTIGFQTNQGLFVDGEVGRKTWTAGLSNLT